jgi:Ankyrin repeat
VICCVYVLCCVDLELCNLCMCMSDFLFLYLYLTNYQDGDTPLHDADNKEVALLLLQHGANLTLKNTVRMGRTQVLDIVLITCLYSLNRMDKHLRRKMAMWYKRIVIGIR